MVEQKGVTYVKIIPEEKRAIAEGKIEFMTLDEVNAEVRRRRSE